MKEKISIVVPVYNVEKYLRRCIDSLIGQSYSNLEIILVDDDSKDGSLAICKEYEKRDVRIQVFHKDNEGLGLTRNYGITRATGEYITFVDSDDYLAFNAIEVMLQKAVNTKAEVIIANLYYKNNAQKVMLPERLYRGDEIRELLIVHMMGNYANKMDALSYTATAKLFKRSLFIENNLVFPSERKLIWEDLAFSVNAYQYCKSVYVLHEPVYYYCFNQSSLTHTYKPNKLELVMILYRYMIDKIYEMNLAEEAQFRLDTNFIGHIRTCIKLEVFYARQNGFRRATQNIRDICNRPDVQSLIRSYPKNAFNKSQRVYNFFMKHSWTYGIYFLTWLQNKKKRIE